MLLLLLACAAEPLDVTADELQGEWWDTSALGTAFPGGGDDGLVLMDDGSYDRLIANRGAFPVVVQSGGWWVQAGQLGLEPDQGADQVFEIAAFEGDWLHLDGDETLRLELVQR